jgi:PA14 domain
MGNYVERKDKGINFFWTGSSPIKAINKDNFSVLWEGYLLAPASGNYIFTIETDGGARLEINEDLVLEHKMYIEEETKERTDIWLLDEISRMKVSNSEKLRTSSKNIHLGGGSKFK